MKLLEPLERLEQLELIRFDVWNGAKRLNGLNDLNPAAVLWRLNVWNGPISTMN